MRFDWRAFCINNRVEFVDRGPNVARGNIGIRGPWCGHAAPSQHMGLSLDVNNPAWGCFRNGKHRGRDPIRLIIKLTGMSWESAKNLVKSTHFNDEDFMETVQAALGEKSVAQSVDRTPQPALVPNDFRFV